MSDVDAGRLLAREHQLEFVDLDSADIDPTAAAVLPASIARRYQVVPIREEGGVPVIALSNPGNILAADTIRATIGREFIAVVASPEQIVVSLERLYGMAAAANGHPVPAANGHAPGPVNGHPAVTTPDAVPTSVQGAEASSPPAPVAPGGQVVPPAGYPAPPSPGSDPHGQPGRITFGSPAPPLPPFDPIPAPPSGVLPQFSPSAAAPPVGPPGDGVPAADDLPPLPPLGQVAAAAPPFSASAGNGNGNGLSSGSGLPGAAVPEDAGVVTVVEPAPGADAAGGPSTDVPVGPGGSGGPPPAGAPGPDSAAAASFPPLARILVEGRRVSLQNMQEVLEQHDETGQSIARILAARKLATEADLMWGMAAEMGLEFVDLDIVGTNIGAALLIPESTARHHNVLCIGDREGVPIVAASNPTDVFAMDDLRTIIGRNFITVVATRAQIETCLDRAYSAGGDASEAAINASREVGTAGMESELDDIQISDDAPIVRYANLLILQAINERASDIHVEPTAHDLRIRYRVDGVLHDSSSAPRSIAASVTTRLKVLANMNIAERRVPQDGRISLNVGARQIDLRMATLPTIHGEKVVMRVLDKSSVAMSFEELGFDPNMLKSYEQVYTKPYGTIFVTGPTGSGKTTTLYATLLALNSPDRNIITVEDPVELQIKGINQIQLNVKAGLTFASALRSILRSDPDVVLVGEVRDKETALISIEAALTGHLVLTTLHTNTAASAPMRLVEMGIEPYLVTSALSGVIAQRLARRLCPACKEPYEPSEADLVSAGWGEEDVLGSGGATKLFRAVGCPSCMGTGYRGRMALAEFLAMDEGIEHMILEGKSAGDIHRASVERGMVTLRQSGLRKALEGETTLEEVLRVVT